MLLYYSSLQFFIYAWGSVLRYAKLSTDGADGRIVHVTYVCMCVWICYKYQYAAINIKVYFIYGKLSIITFFVPLLFSAWLAKIDRKRDRNHTIVKDLRHELDSHAQECWKEANALVAYLKIPQVVIANNCMRLAFIYNNSPAANRRSFD